MTGWRGQPWVAKFAGRKGHFMSFIQPTLLQRSVDPRLIPGLRAIVGERYVLIDEAAVAPHLVEWRHLYRGACACVVKPANTADVAAIVQLCGQLNAAIVPQGGNTGLVGGQIPFDSGAVVLSLARLDRLRSIDPQSNAMTVEAGMTLRAAQDAAAAADRLFPLSLASEGSCLIGGNIATNAGGTAVLAYGNMRDLVLGLEVVLADGRIWNGLRALRKDNTGYDLKNLFIGSEGTLGIVTAAVLKLFPKPRAQETAFIGVETPEAALGLLNSALARAGRGLTTYELMPRFGVDIVLKHAPGSRDPLSARYPWYVLMEVSSGQEEPLRPFIEGILEEGIASGLVKDAALADSLEQRRALWRLREAMSEVQSLEGGSIKHDVAVPVHLVPQFLTEALAMVNALIPGCRPCAFGHAGDGNIHFNISQPEGADRDAFIARWEEVNAAVHRVVARLNGSISAEHGIGLLKREALVEVKEPVELDLMRQIKGLLDPTGLMNPGKVV